jgi:hypothetical protein
MADRDGYATVPIDMLYGLLLYSTRYALGRSSYAPGQIMDYLRAYAPRLHPQNRNVIANNILDELERFPGVRYRVEWAACADDIIAMGMTE